MQWQSYWFSMLNQCYIVLTSYFPFLCGWTWFAKPLFRLTFLFVMDIYLLFYFCFVFYGSFGWNLKVMLSSWNRSEISPPFIVWVCMYNTAIGFLFKWLIEFNVTSFSHGSLSMGRFLIINSTFVIDLWQSLLSNLFMSEV